MEGYGGRWKPWPWSSGGGSPLRFSPLSVLPGPPMGHSVTPSRGRMEGWDRRGSSSLNMTDGERQRERERVRDGRERDVCVFLCV